MNITEKIKSSCLLVSTNAFQIWNEIKKIPSSVICFFSFDLFKCGYDFKNKIIQVKNCSFQNCKKIIDFLKKDILCIQSNEELLFELNCEALNLLKNTKKSKNILVGLKKEIYSKLIFFKPTNEKNNLVLELDLRLTKLNVGQIISFLNNKKTENREIEVKNLGMMTFLLNDIIEPSLERKITNYLKTKQIRNERPYTIFLSFRLNGKNNPYFFMIEKVNPLNKPIYIERFGTKNDLKSLKYEWLS